MRLLRLFGLVFVVLLAVGVPIAASDTLPDGGGANNVVIAQTQDDAATIVRSSLQLSTAGGPSLTSANIATATSAACTSCSTTAVAVQVVLVSGSPSYYVPANVAGATTAGCSGCGAFAYAWQYVPQVSRDVTLTRDARTRVAELRAAIAETAAAYDPKSLDGALALHAALDELTAELKAVVDGVIAAAGATATGEPVEIAQATPSG